MTCARDPIAPLDRLVRIGIRAEIDRADAIAGLGQFRAQQFGRIGLGEQFGLEIDARRTDSDSRATAARSNRCSRARSRDTD